MVASGMDGTSKPQHLSMPDDDPKKMLDTSMRSPGAMSTVSTTAPDDHHNDDMFSPNSTATSTAFDATNLSRPHSRSLPSSPNMLTSISEPSIQHHAHMSPSSLLVSSDVFRGNRVMKRRPKEGGSPLAVPPPYRGPAHPFLRNVDVNAEVDYHGFPNIQVAQAAHSKEYNERHQLHLFSGGRHEGDVREDNTNKCKGERLLFADYDTLDELKAHLGKSRSGRRCLKSGRHSMVEIRQTGGPKEFLKVTSPISADGALSQMPDKYDFGGTMKDRDHKVRQWDNRWAMRMSFMNDGMHKSHRDYFVEKSVFEDMPSQRWRCMNKTQNRKHIVDKKEDPAEPRFIPNDPAELAKPIWVTNSIKGQKRQERWQPPLGV